MSVKRGPGPDLQSRDLVGHLLRSPGLAPNCVHSQHPKAKGQTTRQRQDSNWAELAVIKELP